MNPNAGCIHVASACQTKLSLSWHGGLTTCATSIFPLGTLRTHPKLVKDCLPDPLNTINMWAFLVKHSKMIALMIQTVHVIVVL